MFVCCVLSGRGLCNELITRPEESHRIWRVVVCDQETSWYEEAIAHAGLQSQRNKQHLHSMPNKVMLIIGKSYKNAFKRGCWGVAIYSARLQNELVMV
jgi:hypothetical protein